MTDISTDHPTNAAQGGTVPAAVPALFPFSAITGQPELCQALLLAALDPHIGGVLIEGPRGTAKSTAARALAELIEGAPFVTLPLGASLEHVAGTLSLAHALAGHTVEFAPGLLARAHGGVLYVDEINLLADALVDVVLDAAASGANVVERDGISHSHAARFVLVGTMNPEEGALRPQLLDRLGLCVQLANVASLPQRLAIVRARLEFDADPVAFRARHAQAQAALARRLADARQLLQRTDALPLTDAVMAYVGQRCMEEQVDGLRADLVLLRAARAWAAWHAAEQVDETHVNAVAEWVLRHRRKPGQAPRTAAAPASAPNPTSQGRNAQPGDNGSTQESDGGGAGAENEWGYLPPQPVPLERMHAPSAFMPRQRGVLEPKKV